MSQETVSFEDVTAMKETGAALLCWIEGEEVWIPKFLISEDSEVQGDEDEGVLIIPEWLAIEKELV